MTNESGGTEQTTSPAALGDGRRRWRTSGILLIITAVLTVAFMAMHPTSGTRDLGEFADRAAKGFPGNAMVHGIMIGLTIVMTIAFMGLVDIFFAGLLIVRFAIALLILGSAGAVAAGLINGFILPSTAAYLSDAPVEQFEPIFRLCQMTNATCARLCVIGWSLSAVLWGIAMLHGRGVLRIVGPVGVLFGVALLSMLVYGHLPMNVKGFGMFVSLHCVWSMAAGVGIAIGKER